MDSLVAANTKFCFDLFQEISKDDPHKNIFFCPLSLSAALGMVRLGARSESAQQIDQVWLRYLWVHPQSQTLVLLLQAMMLTEPGAWGGGGRLHLPWSFHLHPTLLSLQGWVKPLPPLWHFFSLPRLITSLSHILCLCVSVCLPVYLFFFCSIIIHTDITNSISYVPMCSFIP